MSKLKVLKGLELPDHNEKLQKADEKIKEYKQIIHQVRINKHLTLKEYALYHTRIVNLLEWIGDLSLPAFKIEDELEKRYISMYKNSPELSKSLWLDHYHEIHQPYNILKNRCFTLLDQLEEMYIKFNKCLPPDEF